MKEILSDELIGLKVEVVECLDESKVGIRGKVVDETMKTLTIETNNGDKIIPKDESVFSFDYKNKKVYVDGRMLLSRPEDRVKKGKRNARKWRFPKFFFKH